MKKNYTISTAQMWFRRLGGFFLGSLLSLTISCESYLPRRDQRATRQDKEDVVGTSAAETSNDNEPAADTAAPTEASIPDFPDTTTGPPPPPPPPPPRLSTINPSPPIIEDFEEAGRFAASLPDTIAWASTSEWRLSIVAGPLGAATNTVTDSALLVTVRRDGYSDTLGALPVTRIMKAYLQDVDDAFEIAPESVQEKAIGHRRHRTFTWLLTPKKAGAHLLRLQIVKTEPGTTDAQVMADEYTLLKRRVVVPRSLAYWRDVLRDSVKDYWVGWVLALLTTIWAWVKRRWLGEQITSRPRLYRPRPAGPQ